MGSFPPVHTQSLQRALSALKPSSIQSCEWKKQTRPSCKILPKTAQMSFLTTPQLQNMFFQRFTAYKRRHQKSVAVFFLVLFKHQRKTAFEKHGISDFLSSTGRTCRGLSCTNHRKIAFLWAEPRIRENMACGSAVK